MLGRSIPLSAGILFALEAPVAAPVLRGVVRALENWGQSGIVEDSAASVLERRWKDAIPWEILVPQPGLDAPQRELNANAPSIDNIVRVRGFPRFSRDGLVCCMDWLNPQNELAMPDNCLPTPTLALLFGEEDTAEARGAVRNRLAANEGWWALVHQIATLVPVVRVVGVRPLGSLLSFVTGEVDSRYSAWDFLFPIDLVNDLEVSLDSGTVLTTEGLKMLPRRAKLARVDDWGALGKLVVTRAGLDAVVNHWEYWALGRLLGRTPIETVPDSVPPWPAGLPLRSRGVAGR